MSQLSIAAEAAPQGAAHRKPGPRPGLGLIGLGAFGRLCQRHLEPHFSLLGHDPMVAGSASLAEVASQPVVVLAVPLAAIAETARAIAPHLRPGALVVDVCSLKMRPLAELRAALPADVEVLGTHPLFGPQSGRDGIAGLPIVLCPGAGPRTRLAERFLRRHLGLVVSRMSAEEHDRQMAHVQGLSHLLTRILLEMDLPELPHATTAFAHLRQMIALLRHDSEALFHTITAENPFMPEVTQRFLASTQAVLGRLPKG